jgi:hypothetical protein
MKPKLSQAAIQLREQFDDSFPSRDRTSDGWIGDTRHAARPSDHNPDAQGWVRAIDVDRDVSGRAKPDLMPDIADQIRLLCKSKKERRITYIIFDGRIASSKKAWAWREYTGSNKHNHHCHISFSPQADNDSAFFQVPMLGGTDDRSQ